MRQPPFGPAARPAHERPAPGVSPGHTRRAFAAIGGFALGSLLAAAAMQSPEVAQHARGAVALLVPVSVARVAVPTTAVVSDADGSTDALRPLLASHVMAVPPLQGSTTAATTAQVMPDAAATPGDAPTTTATNAAASVAEPSGSAAAAARDAESAAVPSRISSPAPSQNPRAGREAQAAAAGANTTPALAQPSPSLTPRQVVAIQLEALQQVDVPARDAGIAVVFRFASPENRSQTGPLARFSRMVREGYPEMLNHRSHTLAGAVVQDGEALQPVELTTSGGRVVRYIFILRQQQDGLYKNCWMTDGVVLPDEQPNGLET